MKTPSPIARRTGRSAAGTGSRRAYRTKPTAAPTTAMMATAAAAMKCELGNGTPGNVMNPIGSVRPRNTRIPATTPRGREAPPTSRLAGEYQREDPNQRDRAKEGHRRDHRNREWAVERERLRHDRVLAPERAERRDACPGRDRDQHQPPGEAHPSPQPAHLREPFRPEFADDHTGSEEEERLWPRVGEELQDGRAIR